jgi:hypothetical protein
MQRIDRPCDLRRIADPVIRGWVAERYLGLIEQQAEARFLVLEPGDHAVSMVWEASSGEAAEAESVSEEMFALFECVEDHGSFYEALVLLNNESGLIVIVPKTGLDGELLARLARLCEGNAIQPPTSKHGNSFPSSELAGKGGAILVLAVPASERGTS